MNHYQRYRQEKDSFFASHPQSPLTDDQKKSFKGLIYFPVNKDLRFTIEIEPPPNQDMVEIQTSTGETQRYLRHGRFTFTVNGKQAELTLFSNEHGYFLPFVDALAGEETYPAGRYLEVETLSNGRFLVDFNMAYNPYCAYNDLWSCPLTPLENRIDVAIRAGEKIFPHTKHQ